MMERGFLAEIRKANEQALDRLRNHPFVRLAHDKALSRAQTHRWIMAAGCDSRAFRAQLQAGVDRLSDLPEYGAVLRIMKENLDDENGNGNPEEAHWRHYIHLARQLGYTEENLLSYKRGAPVTYAVQLADRIPLESMARWIGYMVVNEGATPITYDAEDIALRVHHPELKTEFFRLHVEVDEHHVAELYDAIALLPNASFYEVLEGVALGELGMTAILDEALGLFG